MNWVFWRKRRRVTFGKNMLCIDGPITDIEAAAIRKAFDDHQRSEKLRAEFQHLVATGRAHPSENIGAAEEQQWLLRRMG